MLKKTEGKLLEHMFAVEKMVEGAQARMSTGFFWSVQEFHPGILAAVSHALCVNICKNEPPRRSANCWAKGCYCAMLG